MMKMEERELEGHRAQLVSDVHKLVEKYRAIFNWDVPDIDQAVADSVGTMDVTRSGSRTQLLPLTTGCCG
jgi:hypothetical protein